MKAAVAAVAAALLLLAVAPPVAEALRTPRPTGSKLSYFYTVLPLCLSGECCGPGGGTLVPAQPQHLTAPMRSLLAACNCRKANGIPVKYQPVCGDDFVTYGEATTQPSGHSACCCPMAPTDAGLTFPPVCGRE